MNRNKFRHKLLSLLQKNGNSTAEAEQALSEYDQTALLDWQPLADWAEERGLEVGTVRTWARDGRIKTRSPHGWLIQVDQPVPEVKRGRPFGTKRKVVPNA